MIAENVPVAVIGGGLVGLAAAAHSPSEAGRDLTIDEERAAAGACCGGPARTDVTACCALDERKKAEGSAGCGCATPSVTAAA